MAPLPVTIGAPPETTRSSWSLIKIVAGLIPGPLGAQARRAGLRGAAGGVGAAGLLRHPPPEARGGVRRPGGAAVHQGPAAPGRGDTGRADPGRRAGPGAGG